MSERAPDLAAAIPDGSALVTMSVAGQRFGIPIERVRDVFTITEMTPVPLSRPDVAGLLNMRGRIVTAIDLRRRLGLPEAAAASARTAVGIEVEGDSFGLIVDRVDEIAAADPTLADKPAHLGQPWASLSRAVHRRPDGILIELDVDAVLALDSPSHA
ncbi:MAG: chemotaxis protein CheW [Methylobacteriaceae bacterium]|nr:chemotaxis protein CheW [Methylobacteriaceae bacterium]